jgi:prepilin-type processing-associated H-X9-DG protein
LAVIVILAALLFAVFSSARENARKTTCASNLRQLGVAFALYSSDSDEHLPLPGSSDEYDADQEGPYWDMADRSNGGPINAYLHCRSSDLIHGPSVFLCPDQPPYQETTITIPGANPPLTFKEVTARTYVMNWYLRDRSPDATGQLVYAEDEYPDNDPASAAGLFQEIGTFRNPLAIAHLVDPTDTILLFEGVPVQGVTPVGSYLGPARRSGDFSFQKGYMPSAATTEDVYTAEGIGTDGWNPSTPWHNGQDNYLFCDGHVKSMPVNPYPWVPTPTNNLWYVAKYR